MLLFLVEVKVLIYVVHMNTVPPLIATWIVSIALTKQFYQYKVTISSSNKMCLVFDLFSTSVLSSVG